MQIEITFDQILSIVIPIAYLYKSNFIWPKQLLHRHNTQNIWIK